MSKADVTTRFPFINLEKAIKRAEELYKNDNRGRPMAIPTAFAAWGYSEKSSGGNQTVAALKMYGLLFDSGANENRRIQLTDDAIRFFQEEREDHQNELIAQFALTPKLIEALWSDWGDSPPSDAVARSELKIERKLNEQSSKSLLGIYKDNLAFSEIINSGNLKSQNTGDAPNDDGSPSNGDGNRFGGASVGDLVQWEINGALQLQRPAKVQSIHESGDWVFVDGSNTGIPMSQVIVETVAPITPTPPVAPSSQAATIGEGEREWVRTPLGKGVFARILVTEDLTDTQIEKLRTVLNAMKED